MHILQQERGLYLCKQVCALLGWTLKEEYTLTCSILYLKWIQSSQEFNMYPQGLGGAQSNGRTYPCGWAGIHGTQVKSSVRMKKTQDSSK